MSDELKEGSLSLGATLELIGWTYFVASYRGMEVLSFLKHRAN
jgi:hypothetical protein